MSRKPTQKAMWVLNLSLNDCVKRSESRPVVSKSETPWTIQVLGILQARILEWGSLSLLQGIFLTQGLNPGLPHCRWILYQLSHQGIWLCGWRGFPWPLCLPCSICLPWKMVPALPLGALLCASRCKSICRCVGTKPFNQGGTCIISFTS